LKPKNSAALFFGFVVSYEGITQLRTVHVDRNLF